MCSLHGQRCFIAATRRCRFRSITSIQSCTRLWHLAQFQCSARTEGSSPFIEATLCSYSGSLCRVQCHVKCQWHRIEWTHAMEVHDLIVCVIHVFAWCTKAVCSSPRAGIAVWFLICIVYIGSRSCHFMTSLHGTTSIK